jgi:GntR family transcriptional regulator
MNEARYVQVANVLKHKIVTGGYPVGSLLPTELELCVEYEVSRHTVRAAISQLLSLGLVSRRKRVGTRVEAAVPIAGYRQSLNSVEDLVHLAETQVRSIQHIRRFIADIAEAARLGLEPGGRYFCVSSIRVDQNQGSAPMCWTEVYADERYEAVIDEAQKHPEQLIAGLIEKGFGCRIEVVKQQVRAVLLSDELGKKLNAEPGSAALKIVRQYRDEQDNLIVLSETTHPDDRFTLVMNMRREQA